MAVAPEKICFGRWQLDLQRRTLLADGEAVELRGRGFDLLALLVAHPGEALTKDDIFSSVWHGTTVSEANLTVQISNLRKVLGESADESGLIVTVPGRGYKFAGEVVSQSAATNLAEVADPQLSTNEPSQAIVATRFRGWRPTVASLALVLISVLGGASLVWRPTPIAPRLSIAVLPFRSLNPDPAQAYLADALTDDLRTDLAHIPRAIVIARESTDAWRGRSVPVQQIGRALGVRYVVEGSLRLEDGQYTINAQLVDAANGGHLWAERFDTAGGRIVEARDAIVRRLALALNFQLGQIENTRSLHDRPNDPDELDLYFRARAILDLDSTLEGLTRAQDMLERAIGQKSDFADAAALLGTVLLMKVEDTSEEDETKDMRRAHEVIAQALALSPRNAEAIAARARELAAQGHWTEATYSAKMSLEIEPSNVPAYAVLARCALSQARVEDAASYMERISKLTPNSFSNKRRFLTFGYIRLLQHRVQDAIGLLQFAIAGDRADFNPEIMGRIEVTHLLLVAATAMDGDIVKAHAMYIEYSKHWPNRTGWRFAGYYGRAESHIPGFQLILQCLEKAGMSYHADEKDRTPASTAACVGNDFDATPQKLNRGETWTTAELAAHLKSKPTPLVIDLGQGVAVPYGAYWSNWSSNPETPMEAAQRMLTNAGAFSNHSEYSGSPIVVMGDGPFGCDAYDVTTKLAQQYPTRAIVWYRGGEEVWAANNMPSTDARP